MGAGFQMEASLLEITLLTPSQEIITVKSEIIAQYAQGFLSTHENLGSVFGTT